MTETLNNNLEMRPNQFGSLSVLKIRICFGFRASDFEFGSGLSGLGYKVCFLWEWLPAVATGAARAESAPAAIIAATSLR